MSRAETSGESLEARRHAEIMAAIASLRRHVQPDAAHSIVESQEALRLKVELDAISEAIQRTKQEIATLHYAGAQGREIARVTDELGEIVLGTEAATHAILAAAESVDDIAGRLAVQLSGEQSDMARQIADRIIGIFEACNFQDITGQRISKVVTAMRFVEDRVGKMIEIWGGLESFKDVPTVENPDRKGDRELLNGPALQTEISTSQDDIDAFFK
ncbi:protein phosphatase CheZ [Microvirga alba]|nr:protein phosphatase CheZ [Microvirga alba]